MSSPRVPLRQTMLSRTNLICPWIHVQFGMSTPPVNIPNLARFFLGAFYNMPVTQRVPWFSRTSKMVKNYIEKNQNVQTILFQMFKLQKPALQKKQVRICKILVACVWF